MSETKMGISKVKFAKERLTELWRLKVTEDRGEAGKGRGELVAAKET